MKSIVLCGGCFWSVQHKISSLEGVMQTLAGYAGGHLDSPTYRDVCSGNSGHAECVKVDFDESILSLSDLLRIFFKIHDPTQYMRQGPDVGAQYRTAIFCTTIDDLDEALRIRSEVAAAELKYGAKVYTEIELLKSFHPAEEEHQHYYQKWKPGIH